MRQLLLTTLAFSVVANPVLSLESVIFKKVDYFEVSGEDEKKRDARLELRPETKMLVVSDEKKGPKKRTYASIPYGQISKIVYERSAHTRYKSSALLLGPMGLPEHPLHRRDVTRQGVEKHWLTIEFKDVPEHPLGYIYMRLDKGNYQRVLAALSAGTDIEIEKIVED